MIVLSILMTILTLLQYFYSQGDLLLKITGSKQGDVSVITLTGAVVLSNVDKARTVFHEELESSPEAVAFDCKGVTSLDSSGLGMFIGFSKEATKRNMKIILYDIPEDISRLFNISKLTGFFDIISEEEFKKNYLS